MDVSQRNFSVSDLLEKASGLGSLGSLGSFGGLGSWGSFGGFHRSESEHAFQDFLKRIPSSNGLQQLGDAAAPPAPQQQQQQQQQQPQQRQALQQPMLPSATMGMTGSSNVPRVNSSVDFLAQLASMQQQTYGVAPAMKLDAMPAQPATYLPTLTAADLATLQASALAAPQFGVSPHFGALQHNSAASHAAAAAATSALQLNQLPKLNQPHPGRSNGPSLSGQNSGPGSSNNDRDTEDIGEKTGVRRARRMLSNRESARRSRRRKQEHLGQLESDINVLLEEKKAWMDKIAGLARRLSSAEDENKRLREENVRLLDELHFLRSELKESGSYARQNGRNNSGEDKANASKRMKVEANENASIGE